MTNKSKTEYVKLLGKVSWAKVYEPDEFRGATNWTLNFYPRDASEWDKIKQAGIQRRPKEDDGTKSGVEGRFIPLKRPTTKLIKGKMVYFTPPRIFNKDGSSAVSYTNNEGRAVYSYDDEKTIINRVGDSIQIGNGSEVEVTLSVYQTAMGPGNRLEGIKILDLIVYEKPQENTLDDEIPF